MDLFVFGGASGSFLVHLPQIFPRFYGTEIYDTDHSGYDPEFPAPFPGHQDSSPGYILRHMDWDRRSRSSIRRNAAVQRSLDTSEAFLRPAHTGRYHRTEDHFCPVTADHAGGPELFPQS